MGIWFTHHDGISIHALHDEICVSKAFCVINEFENSLNDLLVTCDGFVVKNYEICLDGDFGPLCFDGDLWCEKLPR